MTNYWYIEYVHYTMVYKIISKTKYSPLVLTLFLISGMFLMSNIKDRFHRNSNVLNNSNNEILSNTANMKEIVTKLNEEIKHKSRDLEGLKTINEENKTSSHLKEVSYNSIMQSKNTENKYIPEDKKLKIAEVNQKHIFAAGRKKKLKHQELNKKNDSYIEKFKGSKLKDQKVTVKSFSGNKPKHDETFEEKPSFEVPKPSSQLSDREGVNYKVQNLATQSCLNTIRSKEHEYACKQKKQKSGISILMFTAIYSIINGSNFTFINNTLTSWSKIKTKIKPVLFIVPNENNLQAMKSLAKTACSIGWDVQIAPECYNGMPVLKSMFELVYARYNSPWYGFAKSTVSFDKTLVSAVNKVNNYAKKIRPYGLLAGDAHIFQVEVADEKLHRLDQAQGPSYFITKRNGFPWSLFPKLVIGQPHVYNYLLWFTHYHKKTFEIDVTEAIFAIQQTADKNKNNFMPRTPEYDETTTAGHKTDYSMKNTTLTSYNEQLIAGMTYKDRDMNSIQYVKEKGITKCLTYKLGHINSPYIKLFKRYATFVPSQDPAFPCSITKYTLVKPDFADYDEFDME